jgi:AcrR family transcriptional regulator
VNPTGQPDPVGSALAPRPNASRDLTRGRARHTSRRAETQRLVLDTAERLFVEHGVLAVSNQQIGEAAGYGNSAIVGYHFGTNADLVRAIIRRFTADVERSRESMLAELDGSTEARDWLACMVLPWTDHFEAHGPHSYFARLCAQALDHPSLRTVIGEEAVLSPSLRRTLEALNRYLPFTAPTVATERGAIMEYAIVHTCAERERALAERTPTLRETWRDAAGGLIDALAGIWTAPATASPRRLTRRART